MTIKQAIKLVADTAKELNPEELAELLSLVTGRVYRSEEGQIVLIRPHEEEE